MMDLSVDENTKRAVGYRKIVNDKKDAIEMELTAFLNSIIERFEEEGESARGSEKGTLHSLKRKSNQVVAVVKKVMPTIPTEAEPVSETPITVASITPEAETAGANTKSSKGSIWGFFDKESPAEVTATITDILNKDQQKMAFLLSNDEIWLQNSPRNLPIRSGDEVTIKKASLGGYIMRNSSGTSTRVRRIK